jgi:hypothetical protein
VNLARGRIGNPPSAGDFSALCTTFLNRESIAWWGSLGAIAQVCSARRWRSRGVFGQGYGKNSRRCEIAAFRYRMLHVAAQIAEGFHRLRAACT